MVNVLLPLLVIILLIVLNGVFVAAEFAIVAAPRPRHAQGGKQSWASRYVRRVLSSTSSQDRYIAIAQLGITLATIGLGMYGEPAIAAWIYGPVERAFGISEAVAHTVGTVLAVLAMTYFHVVVGEMIPKALALQSPERTAMGVARPMYLTGIVFRPLVALLNGVGNALLRLFRVPLGGEARFYSPAELVHLVDESRGEGAVSEEEQQLIRNILDFGELEVRHVMVPRVKVACLSVDASWDQARSFIGEHQYSRYPVYQGDLDRVVGILHVRDFIKRDVAQEPSELRSLVRRVPRVPEAMPIERLLTSFKRLHVHMAIVVGEHGGTSGIVTLDDLLEEVVGDVEDEFDIGERPEVEEMADGTFLVDGGLPLYHFNERFATQLEAEESTTTGGFVLEQLKRVPRRGDEVSVQNLLLRVEEMEGLAIGRLLVVPLKEDT
ncbi:MAG: hemolysin family protein [Trueperaceae bacterium]